MKPSTSTSVLLLSLAVVTTAAAAMAGAVTEGAATYLVYVDPHPPGVDCQAYQLGILAAALGGEEKAKAAIVYNYKNVVSGFSARLTPWELEAVKKQPHVNRVLPSATLELMSSKFDGVS
ncbi:subtilisin-like protease SBT3.3 [Phragmites australis]|uniref:subtilisin-like protease SBT3.3 n=1 Tax=Phragmites australis TaxID=29695 RepID=UPI002D7836F6|nr:subtilisin-like protease SBT3.3 [Phragmites australis]